MKNATQVNNSAKVKAHFLVNDRKMTKTDVAKEFGVSRRTLGRWLDEVEQYRAKAQEEYQARKQQAEQAKPEPVLPRPVKKVAVVVYRCTTVRVHRQVQKVQAVNQRLNQNLSDFGFALAAALR